MAPSLPSGPPRSTSCPLPRSAPCRSQEAFFQHLFGVNDAEDYLGALDLRTGRSILFMPRLPESYAVWMGHILTPEEVQVGGQGGHRGMSWLGGSGHGLGGTGRG